MLQHALFFSTYTCSFCAYAVLIYPQDVFLRSVLLAPLPSIPFRPCLQKYNSLFPMVISPSKPRELIVDWFALTSQLNVISRSGSGMQKHMSRLDRRLKSQHHFL